MNLKLINLISGFLESLNSLDGETCPFCGGQRNYEWTDYYHHSGCPEWSVTSSCKEAIEFLTTHKSAELED